MKRLVLDQEVQICGRDFFGRSTSVTLRPTVESGWFWQAGNEVVPLSPDLLRSEHRRLVLAHGSARLNVYEHLGVLRFSGLDNVLIVSKSDWLPYDGCATLFWDAVWPHLRSRGALGWCRAKTMDHQYSGSALEKELRYQTITIGEMRHLILDIRIKYPGLGPYVLETMLPNGSFDKFASPKTPGWPRYLRPVAKLASAFGWPHGQCSVWPQEYDQKTAARLFAEHRLLDLLGALSVACLPGQILSGHITSVCAGHKEDVAFVKGLQVESMQSACAA